MLYNDPIKPYQFFNVCTGSQLTFVMIHYVKHLFKMYMLFIFCRLSFPHCEKCSKSMPHGVNNLSANPDFHKKAEKIMEFL